MPSLVQLSCASLLRHPDGGNKISPSIRCHANREPWLVGQSSMRYMCLGSVVEPSHQSMLTFFSWAHNTVYWTESQCTAEESAKQFGVWNNIVKHFLVSTIPTVTWGSGYDITNWMVQHPKITYDATEFMYSIHIGMQTPSLLLSVLLQAMIGQSSFHRLIVTAWKQLSCTLTFPSQSPHRGFNTSPLPLQMKCGSPLAEMVSLVRHNRYIQNM